MNYLFDKMPQKLDIFGKRYPINTDFRAWMQLNESVINEDPDEFGRLANAMFKCAVPQSEDFAIEAFKQMSWFLRCGEQPSEKRSGPNTFSYSYDSNFIIAAFQEFYRIDLLRTKYMHWWKFNMLLNAMSSQSELKERVRIRGMNPAEIKDPKQRATIKKLQKMIAIPNKEMEDEDIGAVLW